MSYKITLIFIAIILGLSLVSTLLFYKATKTSFTFIDIDGWGLKIQNNPNWQVSSSVYEDIPNTKLIKKDAIKAKFSNRNLPEINIGTSTYSTSTAICSNEICETLSKNEKVTILGKIYEFEIIEASVMDQDTKTFDFYTFQFQLDGIEKQIKGYSEPISPTITASFSDMSELPKIKRILESISK